MNSQSYGALQRVATNCQDETFPQGMTVVEPSSCPSKIFFIMQGGCARQLLLLLIDTERSIPDSPESRSRG